MPTVDYGKLLGDLKDAILGTVKDNAKEFLDANKDAQDFLEDRAKRVAELGVEYAKAKASGGDTDQVSTQMSVVLQSIRNELAGIAVQAEAEARATFGKILETALGVVVKALPVILAAV